jgi:tricorn protease interacting factor F2/3
VNGPPPPTVGEYRLSLSVDFDSGRWTGRVEYSPPDGTAATALDAEGLEVRGVWAGSEPLPYQYRRDASRIDVPGASPGQTIAVEFSGVTVPGTLVGLYRCAHGGGSALTSQCEAIGARRIFPCVDRPDRKARFRLTVRTRADLEVISNTPVETLRSMGGDREWAFEPTPPMSTYLLYLGVGRFDRWEEKGGRVAVRVLAPPGRGAAGEYAARAGRRILEGYEEYFRIPYPLAKLDLLAFSDHAFGAMENWGAISFRDIRLLIDATADSYARRDVFETVAHEIAHQWFGNLVTMATWDDVWLNESFAALMETRLSERLIPDLEPLTDFYLRVAGASAAFDGDSLSSTHPVRAHVERPEEISQIFDEISYGKGSTVLAMLESFLGPDRFRAGVVEYLNRFRYANARTEDLWVALGHAGDAPIEAMATPWIDRPGHPLIRARLDGSTVRLEQQRFSFLPREKEEPPWPIPLVIEVDGSPRRAIFSGRRMELTVPPDAIVHLNPGAVGFYRVLYDAPLFDRLLKALPGRRATDAWSVANDLASFLYTGDTDWRTFVRFVRRVGASDELLLSDALGGALQRLYRVLPASASVQDESRRYFAERLDSVGLRRQDGESPSTGVQRQRIAGGRVRVDEAFARELAELFGEWEHLDPDLRPAVAVAQARTEGAAGWNELRRAHARARTEGEAVELARALAWTSDPASLTATLDLTLTGEIIRGHAVPTITQAAGNPAGREVVWTWLTRHMDEIAAGLRGSVQVANLFDRALPLVGLGRAEELRAFFRGHPCPEGTRGIAKGLERLEVYERLRARAARFVD